VGRYIADQFVERVRQATDIVRLVQESLPLRRAGSAYKALCPFHKEKTPSFHVNPERQIFKCFGCGAAGDVFTFVMKMEGLGFGEAVRLLAERANIELPADAFGGPRTGEKTALYEVNAWAAETFHRWLVEHRVGEPAREYLKGRGIEPKLIQRFGLGYSPAGPDSLCRAAERRGLAPALLDRAGLALRREDGGRRVDRFRNRLMFPIRDVRGRVVGFGGRSLDGSEPKYLNSPETPLFSKGRVLYGLHEARDALRERRRALVVEGYTDALAAHGFGLTWTVAVLGTALTRDHVRLLRRYVDEAVLVFDADSAGQSSALRSVDAFAAEELAVRVAVLPEGLDPDDCLRREGPEAFLRRVEGAPDGVAFKLQRALASLPEGARGSGLLAARALDDVLATVALMPNPVAQSLEVKKIARATGLPEPALLARVERLARSGPGRWERTAPPAPPRAAREPERELLEVMLACPATVEVVRRELDPDLLRDRAVRGLIQAVLERAAAGEPADAADLLRATGDEAQRAVLEEVLGRTPPAAAEPEVYCRELIARLHERALRKTAEELQSRVSSGPLPEEDQDRILREKQRLLQEALRRQGKLSRH